MRCRCVRAGDCFRRLRGLTDRLQPSEHFGVGLMAMEEDADA